MTVTIGCVISEENKLYPQVCLDEALYSLQKMLKYDKLILQKELTLIRLRNQENVCFFIIGIT